jgi:L-ascorbate metabolism protein UlaG (beta-lactamase superfamily)
MSTVTITRITHSCVLLDFDGTRILTDPWFSERPGYYRGEPLGIALDALPQLDGVVVSHAHYDHYDIDAFQAYPDKQVPIVVKRGTAGPALKVGFKNVTELDPWETTTLGMVKVTGTPAKHGVPENTYVLESGDFTVYFGGDTLLIPELNEIATRFPSLDLALLPINGLHIRPLFNRKVVMSAQDAAELCAILHPRVVVPIHYTFTAGPLRDRLLLKYDGTPNQFVQTVMQRSRKTFVRILAPGEPLRLTHEDEPLQLTRE